MQFYAKYLPGIALAFSVGMIGKFLSTLTTGIGEVSFAILVGITLGQKLPQREKFNSGLLFGEKKILASAILLMGFELNIYSVAALGIRAIGIISCIIISTIFIARALGPIFKVRGPVAMLIGIGNAICGSSAIAATSSFISKEPEDIGLAIGTTNLLGTTGLFCVPVMVSYLEMTDIGSSIVIGGSLQAVGHVVAAGYSLSENIGELSTAIKMARVCFLIPLILILSKTYSQPQVKKAGIMQKLSVLPPFLYGFILCAVISHFKMIPPSTLTQIKSLSHLLILVAMSSIGLRIRIGLFLKQGPKAIALGLATFVSQITTLIILTLITSPN